MLSKLFPVELELNKGYEYTPLADDELKEIEESCKRWMLPLWSNVEDDKVLRTLDSFYEWVKDIDFGPAIRAFTERLKEIPYEFSHQEEISGSICFFGGIFTSLLNFGCIKEIDGLFYFASFYMILDHFLDNPEIQKGHDVEQIIIDIYKFLNGDKNVKNPIIAAASEKYFELIERIPRCKDPLRKLFIAEIKGYVIQKRSDLSRETYLQIATEKGALTSSVIGSIVGVENMEDTKNMGSIVQYLDDALDVTQDIIQNAYTLARYDLDNGNWDRYILFIVRKVEELSSVYNFFKWVFIMGIILTVHDIPNSVSDRLYKILEKYDIYNTDTSKDSLAKWFADKLYSYINKNKLRKNIDNNRNDKFQNRSN